MTQDNKALAERLEIAAKIHEEIGGQSALAATIREAAAALRAPSTPSAQAGEVVRIGELIRTQDNRITSHPIFVVEQKREHVSHPDYDHDHFVWVDGDGEATAEDAARLDAEYADTGKTPDGWRRCAVGHSWEFVTACFTEQGCKDYLAANGHNLRETRIFVYSGWRNAEWQAIRAYLSVTPQPQGDSSGQVSGGGEAAFGSAVRALIEQAGDEEWSNLYFCEQVIKAHNDNPATPQARPDDVAARAWQEGYAQGVQDERISEANIGIAGFNAKVEPARVNPYGATHPTPAPDAVARLVEACRQLDRHCANALWAEFHDALAPFTAAQQEGSRE